MKYQQTSLGTTTDSQSSDIEPNYSQEICAHAALSATTPRRLSVLRFPKFMRLQPVSFQLCFILRAERCSCWAL